MWKISTPEIPVQCCVGGYRFDRWTKPNKRLKLVRVTWKIGFSFFPPIPERCFIKQIGKIRKVSNWISSNTQDTKKKPMKFQSALYIFFLKAMYPFVLYHLNFLLFYRIEYYIELDNIHWFCFSVCHIHMTHNKKNMIINCWSFSHTVQITRKFVIHLFPFDH